LPDHALIALRNLLKRGSIKNDRVRDIILSAKKIKGYPFENVDTITEFHASLFLAEKEDAIQIEWRKHFENEQIERIRLLDAEQLAAYLGITYRPTEIEHIFKSIETKELPSWLSDAADMIQDNWLKGKKAFGLDLRDANKLTDLIAAAKAIGDGLPETEPLDYRQFGARHLNNSKRTKELENVIASLYRWHLNIDTWKPTEVLAQLNLVPIKQPILLRGPIKFKSDNVSLNCEFSPYIGIPVDCIDSLTIDHPPQYVMTIENQSSFNEYTRNIKDDAVIIYTAGFPTKAIQYLFSKITSKLNEDTPCYHWGDTDPHGFMIVKTLQSHSRLMIRPHLMDAKGGERYTSAQLKSLQSIMPVNKFIDKEIQNKMIHKLGLIEQEQVKAIPPAL